MSGIRDMSVLEEAPQDRHPVQTYVLEHDPVVLYDAIRRELRRGGQVYWLHNKVESIERVAASIQAHIPEANVGFGHGKMAEGELSEIWRKMMEQEINVLAVSYTHLQDRKAKARDPISAKLVADLITTAGADRVLTMDLHAPQIQGFFNIPVDHLVGAPLLASFLRDKIGDNADDYVVVSPDLGSVTRARNFAARIGCPLAIIDKRRQRANVSEVMNIIGDVYKRQG